MKKKIKAHFGESASVSRGPATGSVYLDVEFCDGKGDHLSLSRKQARKLAKALKRVAR